MVLHHVGIVVSSLEDAKKFYLAALAPLGYKEMCDYKIAVGLSSSDKNYDFWLKSGKCPEGKGDDIPPTTGLHLAFRADSREVVDEFYKAAMEAGAKCNGPPGPRPQYTPTYYASFVLDAHGNNIEAVHM